MFLLIDGFWASGKSVLKSFLDGHPNLKVSPGQEAIFSSFYRNQNQFKNFSYKEISVIRKIISDSYYYDIEKYHFGNNKTVDWSFKVNLNFYEFEKFWTEKINKLHKWNKNKIIEIIHTSLIKYYYQINYSNAKKSIKVFMEDNNFESHYFYLKNFKKSKLILIQRDFGDVIASMVNRKKNKNIYHTRDFDKINNFDNLIKKKLLCFKNEENKKISKFLKLKFPNRVYICNFDNLIFNTELEMKKISLFLKINYNKVLLNNTHFGKLTKRSDNKNIKGAKIFSKEKNLTKSQINILNIIEGKYNKKDLGLISIYSVLLLKAKWLLYKFTRNLKNKNIIND